MSAAAGWLILFGIMVGATYGSLAVWESPGFARVAEWGASLIAQTQPFAPWVLGVIFGIGALNAFRWAISREGRSAIATAWQGRRPIDWPSVGISVTFAVFTLLATALAFVLLGLYPVRALVSLVAGVVAMRLTLRWLARRSSGDGGT